MTLPLAAAQTILAAALAKGRADAMKPLAIVILDARGALACAAAEDGTSLKRADIARGKAQGALAMGVGSRALDRMAKERPHFVGAVSHSIGPLIPVAGGVLIRNAQGTVIGAVGVSGDTSDNDETAAVAGITAAGLTPDPGV